MTGMNEDRVKTILARTEGVLFDLDGVILDSETPVLECWEAAMERLGLPMPEGFREACRDVIGSNPARTKQVFLERFGEDFPYDRITETRIGIFRERYGAGRIPLKPGIRELLEFLEARGIPAAVASSTPTEIVRQELDAEGLLGYFRVVAGGDQVGRSKPSPDISCARASCWA